MMKLNLYQKVRLKNGKAGVIIEIFNDGEAYMLDMMTDDGEYTQDTIYPADIKSVVVEIEQPYVARN